jgi:ligand-binding sensor domain-containing protein
VNDDTWQRFEPDAVSGQADVLVIGFVEDGGGGDGDIWAVTQGAGLRRFDGDLWYDATPDGMSPSLTAFHQHDGELWLGAWATLAYYDGDTWQFITADNGLLADQVVAIYVDADGGLWVSLPTAIQRYWLP